MNDDLQKRIRDALANPQDYAPWLRIYLAEHGAMIFGDRHAVSGSETPR